MVIDTVSSVQLFSDRGEAKDIIIAFLSDDVAKKLLDDSLAINSDHEKLRQSYLSKIRGVLSDNKVARYYQLESNIDAVLEYELAKRLPLAL